MHYMLSALWLHLIDGIGHYVIFPVEVAHILIMTKNIMTLGYNYSKHRLKKPPGIFCENVHISRLITWIPSRLAWTPAL